MITIDDILGYLNKMHMRYSYAGNKNLKIERISSINNPKPESITWIKKINDFDLSMLDESLNRLIVANFTDKCVSDKLNFIFCDNPKEVFFSILNHFWNPSQQTNTISPMAVVLSDKIGMNVSIGSFSFIDKNVVIGDNVIIKNNVSIEGDVVIGNSAFIASGVVIGTDGYGYYEDKFGLHHKVPHYGGVKIGEYVEIGANTCIDRGTIDDTIIGDYTKIDNLCHIGHNVTVGKNCCIVAASIMCGSSSMGVNSYLAPGAIIMNQHSVGENSVVGLGSIVIKNIPDNCTVFGCPAKILSNNK